MVNFLVSEQASELELVNTVNVRFESRVNNTIITSATLMYLRIQITTSMCALVELDRS